MGGWFFAGTLAFLALRGWARHRPPIVEPPSPGTDHRSDRPSEGLTVDEVRALLRLAELNQNVSGESLPPQPIQARRDQ